MKVLRAQSSGGDPGLVRALDAKGAPIGRTTKAKAKKPAEARITLHGNIHSIPAMKVALMLSMCGAKYDYRVVERERRLSPEYAEISRFTQIPALRHGERNICQSSTILRYLAEHFARFGGRNEMEKVHISEWLDFEADIVSVGIGRSRYVTKNPQASQDFKDFAKTRGDRTFNTLDRHLGSSKFLVGPAPTIADIAIFPWIAVADAGGYNVANWPNVQAWAERLMTFPGAGHPLAIIPKEDRNAA